MCRFNKKLELCTKLAVPRRHERGSSYPLFLAAPGLSRLAREAVLIWPLHFPLQVVLSWPGPTPQPRVDQKPPGVHLNRMAA